MNAKVRIGFIVLVNNSLLLSNTRRRPANVILRCRWIRKGRTTRDGSRCG